MEVEVYRMAKFIVESQGVDFKASISGIQASVKNTRSLIREFSWKRMTKRLKYLLSNLDPL